MAVEREEVITVFKTFIESVLIERDIASVLSFLTEDVIGIGMGEQGMVSGKADVARILYIPPEARKVDPPTLEYADFQFRSYEGRFATVCVVLNIRTISEDQVIKSTLGQLINLRKEDGHWLIYTIQATPLFNGIEEMEAYPIKFAENVLETYRHQEQIAKNAQSDCIAIYRINFTNALFEDCVRENDMVIQTKEGDSYEHVLLDCVKMHLSEEDRYRFLRIFSLNNVFHAYQNGQTELILEYEALFLGYYPTWLKTVLRLYTDKASKDLMGYLYVMDIDKEKRTSLDLQSRAERDPLTDLYNKQFTEVKVRERLRELTPAIQSAFFMIDLDHFKDINDTYGHAEGDRVIRAAADAIRIQMQKDDIGGRVGGDEFALYMQNVHSLLAVQEKAEALCESIRAILPDKPTKTACSIGIVLCKAPASDFSKIYQQADRALYEQKRKGRNGYTFAD